MERRRAARGGGHSLASEDLSPFGSEIVTTSPAMQAVLDLATGVAASDIAVLIEGEPGTGKDLVARMIHRRSKRRFGLFVPVTCGGLSDDLLESELYGHERGAFPGATLRKKGTFELAEGGTLFLDEIAAMSARTQIELLAVLKQKQFLRVGGTRPLQANFRLISATASDLDEMVRRDVFSHDLFHRVSRLRLELPPLRERGDDVVLLAGHFLQRFASGVDRRIEGFTPEALDALRAHSWPGNVGELENTIERAVVLEAGERVSAASLCFEAGARQAGQRPERKASSLLEVERHHVKGILETERWDLARSAEALEVSRGELDALLAKHGLVKGAP
jgi:DNA-binding NtrC family response regulator